MGLTARNDQNYYALLIILENIKCMFIIEVKDQQTLSCFVPLAVFNPITTWLTVLPYPKKTNRCFYSGHCIWFCLMSKGVKSGVAGGGGVKREYYESLR